MTVSKTAERRIKAKMKRLGVIGWSSNGKFTPADIERHLDDIEKMLTGRREAAREYMKRFKESLPKPKKKRKKGV